MGCNFTGSQALVVQGPISGTANQAAFTIMCWIRITDLPSAADQQTYVTWSNGTNGNSRIQLQMRGTGVTRGAFALNCRATDGEAVTRFETNSLTLPQPGSWQHLAGVVDYVAKSGLIYVNGASVGVNLATANNIGAAATSNTPSLRGKIGNTSQNDTTEFMNGIIEDARLYNFAMGPIAIESIFTERGADDFVQGLIQRFPLKDFGSGVQVIQVAPVNNGDRQIGTVSVGTLSFASDSITVTRKRQR